MVTISVYSHNSIVFLSPNFLNHHDGSALPYRRNVKKPTPPQVETVNCAYSGRMIGIGCSLKTPLLLRINETTIPVQTFSISVVQTLYAMSITPNNVIDPCSIWLSPPSQPVPLRLAETGHSLFSFREHQGESD